MAHAVDTAPPRPAIRRLEWSLILPVLVLLGGAALYWFMYHYYRSDTPVHSDGEGYYAYLPAWIAHFDPSFRTVVSGHMLPSYPRLGLLAPHAFGMSLQSNGNWLDKYGVGTAVLMLPFFVIGHVVAALTGYDANGYSDPERFITGVAALAYTVLGLFALRAVLRRWFGDWVVGLTLTAAVFGTGLVSYFTFDATFSHAFAFFALSALLLTTLRWLEQPESPWRAALLGASAGLLVDIRLTNGVLLAAVPVLAMHPSQYRQRLSLFARHWSRVLIVAGCTLLVFLPQMATWYIATGHWLVRSYPGESFDFAHPHLIESLVWLEPHGLLPYAPVLGLSFIGLAGAGLRRRDIALPVTLGFVAFWYVNSSWWKWDFSSSYGDRAYLDVVPLLALPMAALFASLRRWYSRALVAALAAACVLVTSMLTVAWWQVRMHGDGVTAAQYLQILLHPHRLLGPPVRRSP